MSKRAAQQLKRLDRLFDSSAIFVVVALILVLFLIGFYLVMSTNIGTVNDRTEDIKKQLHTVAVASARSELFLLQVRTLDNRLAFSSTPETLHSVKDEFARIDGQLQREISYVVENYGDNPELVQRLSQHYDQLRAQQNTLIDQGQNGATDAEIERFLAEQINPHIESMSQVNRGVRRDIAQSFTRIDDSVAKGRSHAILTATMLLGIFAVVLLMFMAVLMRKNRQQRALRESLSRALEDAQEASNAKSRFLSNVSHDIRTPLTAIIGLANIASEHLDNRGRMEASFDKIKLASHHLLNLVNDVLDVSKVESGQIDLRHAPFDMGDLVEATVSIVRPQADAKHLEFVVAARAVDSTPVLGDRMRVSQVLINLLGNAVKYTEPGGRIVFSVRQLRPEDGEAATTAADAAATPAADDATTPATPAVTEADGVATPAAAEATPTAPHAARTIQFVVEDSGIGMSPAFVERVFDPFEREEGPARFMAEGTGLGMSIAKSLVDSMGGTIQVESVQGKGSRFVVELPFEAWLDPGEDDAAPNTGDDAEATTTPDAKEWSSAHVLLVEDNEIVGEIAEEFIKGTGASLDRAWNGAEAVDIVLSRPQHYYDLVFMDIQMPCMDGLEATCAIVKESARTGRTHPPIIAMTANAYVEDRKRAYEAGMVGYAVKPIGQEEIAQLLTIHAGSNDAEGGRS